MTITVIIFILSVLSSFASIDDAKKLEQISPGMWEVDCKYQKDGENPERANTDSILKGDICNKKEEYSRCVLTVQEILPEKESDDENEINQIISFCNEASSHAHVCIKETSKGLNRREIEERAKLLSIVEACKNSRAGVDKCIGFGLSKVPSREKDNLSERIKFASSCAKGNEATILCLKESARDLKPKELDTHARVIELTNACSQVGLEIDTCLKENKMRSGNHLMYDERKDLIKFINLCKESLIRL